MEPPRLILDLVQERLDVLKAHRRRYENEITMAHDRVKEAEAELATVNSQIAITETWLKGYNNGSNT